jgi:hypothetical protein
VFEEIPEELILRAALVAAAQAFAPASSAQSGRDELNACAPGCCTPAQKN